jgi:hypothetical protein
MSSCFEREAAFHVASGMDWLKQGVRCFLTVEDFSLALI